MNHHELNGKVIIITGASSGFGKGAALEFADSGCKLVLAARRDELIDEVARECEAKGAQAIAVPADVSIADDVKQIADAAVSTFGRIDIWINNAGVAALGRFEEVPLDQHIQVIETNLLGVLYGSYFAMQEFRKQNQGILINVASVLGKAPSPFYSSYTASKHGVVGLGGALRQELLQNGIKTIRVSTVMPPSSDTPFFDHAANYSGHEATPIPPVYDPKDVIDVIVRMAIDPEDEITIGAASKVLRAAHQVAPQTTEKMIAEQTRKTLIDKAPAAPDTEGNVQKPQEEVGTGVSGDRLKKQ